MEQRVLLTRGDWRGERGDPRVTPGPGLHMKSGQKRLEDGRGTKGRSYGVAIGRGFISVRIEQ